jgi:hypothetical protein
LRGVDIRDDQARTTARGGLRGGAADAAGSTGDQAETTLKRRYGRAHAREGARGEESAP